MPSRKAGSGSAPVSLPSQLSPHLLDGGPCVAAPPGSVHCPPGCRKAQEGGTEAGRRSLGWGNGLGRVFPRVQQDVGSAVDLRTWLPNGCAWCSGPSSLHVPQSGSPVPVQVGGSLCLRAGCGPGQSLAGILLAVGLRKCRCSQGDSLTGVPPGLELGVLATRSKGESPAWQSPLRGHGTTSTGTQEGIFLRSCIHCFVVPAQLPQHGGLPKPPPFAHICCLYCACSS